jgi:GNAT superfamily N-acetyltransferase
MLKVGVDYMFEIVPCELHHAKQIAKLCGDSWQQMMSPVLSEEYQLRARLVWFNEQRIIHEIQQGIYTHCAKINEKIVGVIGGRIINETISFISVFHVDSLYRSSGIGKQLLHAFSTTHQILGANRQQVHVLTINSKAILFYERHGFQQTTNLAIPFSFLDEHMLSYQRQI